MKATALHHLQDGATTFRKRQAVYGPSYHQFGFLMNGLFPNGLHIKSNDISSFNRLGIIVQIATKLLRYSASLTKGGHADSAHDMMVYAAMLEELTNHQPKTK
jgi:hypothetical protein